MFTKECPISLIYELYKATGSQVYYRILAKRHYEEQRVKYLYMNPRFW